MSLDGRSILAAGGVADNLADAIRSIGQSFAQFKQRQAELGIQVADRADANAQRAAALGQTPDLIGVRPGVLPIVTGEQDSFHRGLIQQALTNAVQGIKPSPALVQDPQYAAIQSLASQIQARRATQDQAASLGAQIDRSKGIEGGYVQPYTPVPAEMDLAARGAAARQASQAIQAKRAALLDAQASRWNSVANLNDVKVDRNLIPFHQATAAMISSAKDIASRQAMAEGATTQDSNGKLIISDPVRMNQLEREAYTAIGVQPPAFTTYQKPLTPDREAEVQAALIKVKDGVSGFLGMGGSKPGDTAPLDAIKATPQEVQQVGQKFAIPIPQRFLAPGPVTPAGSATSAPIGAVPDTSGVASGIVARRAAMGAPATPGALFAPAMHDSTGRLDGWYGPDAPSTNEYPQGIVAHLLARNHGEPLSLPPTLSPTAEQGAITTLQTLSDPQHKQILAAMLNAAKSGDPDAISHLNDWAQGPAPAPFHVSGGQWADGLFADALAQGAQ